MYTWPMTETWTHIVIIADEYWLCEATGEIRDIDPKIAKAQQRWADECEVQSQARAAEQARSSWSCNDYPGTD